MDRSSCPARRHGTYSAYQAYGCRCADAREDFRLYMKRRREGRAPARLISAIGPTRQLRALQAIGWPLRVLAGKQGASFYTLRRVPRHERVRIDTARGVVTLYARFSSTDGPSLVTENLAWLAGFAPPGAWVGRDMDDPDAVPDWIHPDDPDYVLTSRVVSGERPLSDLGAYKTAVGNRIVVTAEHVEAYRQARHNGASDRGLIATWGVSSKVVAHLQRGES